MKLLNNPIVFFKKTFFISQPETLPRIKIDVDFLLDKTGRFFHGPKGALLGTAGTVKSWFLFDFILLYLSQPDKTLRTIYLCLRIM